MLFLLVWITFGLCESPRAYKFSQATEAAHERFLHWFNATLAENKHSRLLFLRAVKPCETEMTLSSDEAADHVSPENHLYTNCDKQLV